MASISNAETICAVLASLFMLVLGLVLWLVVAPMMAGSHQEGWLVVAYLVALVLVFIFASAMINRSEKRVRDALMTLRPGQKKK